MAIDRTVKFTVRLNMLNPAHVTINKVLNELNLDIFKSKNQFFIDAATYYIENYGQEELTQPKKEKEPEFVSTEDMEVWIYDLRNDMPSFGKTNPLKPEHFDDFIACYADGDLSKRKETYSEENPNGRWRKFSIQDILARDKTSLDITWMKTESDTDNYTLAELLDQIKEKSQNIAKAVSELEQLIGEVEE